MVFGGRHGQRDMAERTTQGRYRQREGEKEERQPVKNAHHDEKRSACAREHASRLYIISR